MGVVRLEGARWSRSTWARPASRRLVGKLDAAADRRAGVLRVEAVHQDAAFTKAMAAAVRREIEDLARWLELDLTLPAAGV